jgi:hypothetical protein
VISTVAAIAEFNRHIAHDNAHGMGAEKVGWSTYMGLRLVAWSVILGLTCVAYAIESRGESEAVK